MPLRDGDRSSLLEVAGASIDHGLVHECPLPVEVERYAAALREPGACFVTLRIAGELRGCTGSLDPSRALVADVALRAFSSAFGDSRFPPLGSRERGHAEIHLSVLGVKEPLLFERDAELLQQLEPGVHGLVIESAGRRATFLPAVWESLPDGAEFLAALKQKAGLPGAPDAVALRAWRYAVEDFASA